MSENNGATETPAVPAVHNNNNNQDEMILEQQRSIEKEVRIN